jgi:hypothetical protein
MTREEFREAVAVRGRELPEKALRVAMECMLRDASGTPQRADIRRCIETAGIIAVEYQTLNAPGNSTPSLALDETPDIRLRSQALTTVIHPWVEKIRLLLFHGSRPPFSSYARAVQWIEREARKQPVKVPLFENEQAKVLHQELDEKRKALGRLTGLSLRLTYTAQRLPFVKHGRQRTVQVRESHLVMLEKTSRRLAQWTGFSQLSLVAHILADTPLLLPIWQYSCTLPAFEGPSPLQVSIHFPSMQDVTVDHMKALYREIRTTFALNKTKKFSQRDALLCALVDSAGGVPPSEKTAFWKKIMATWNTQAAPDWGRWRNWNAPRVAYGRIQKKLTGRPSGAPP